VIGIELEALKSAKRVVGVAGGARKEEAIRATLRGRLVNVLITDKASAENLLKENGRSNRRSRSRGSS
jgi:DNA-binding transcriptional regulator LsrR (DeoR family)